MGHDTNKTQPPALKLVFSRHQVLIAKPVGTDYLTIDQMLKTIERGEDCFILNKGFQVSSFENGVQFIPENSSDILTCAVGKFSKGVGGEFEELQVWLNVEKVVASTMVAATMVVTQYPAGLALAVSSTSTYPKFEPFDYSRSSGE